MMSMDDPMTIGLETSRTIVGALWKKEFIELIFMNPLNGIITNS